MLAAAELGRPLTILRTAPGGIMKNVLYSFYCSPSNIYIPEINTSNIGY